MNTVDTAYRLVDDEQSLGADIGLAHRLGAKKKAVPILSRPILRQLPLAVAR
jgi:hypothetical protein